jgi:hypothetical protein
LTGSEYGKIAFSMILEKFLGFGFLMVRSLSEKIFGFRFSLDIDVQGSGL